MEALVNFHTHKKKKGKQEKQEHYSRGRVQGLFSSMCLFTLYCLQLCYTLPLFTFSNHNLSLLCEFKRYLVHLQEPDFSSWQRPGERQWREERGVEKYRS